MEYLERDGAVVAQIAGSIHGGHATTAELPLDCVATGEWCVRVRDFVVHASRPGATGRPIIRAAGSRAPDCPCRPHGCSHNLLPWRIPASWPNVPAFPRAVVRERSQPSLAEAGHCR